MKQFMELTACALAWVASSWALGWRFGRVGRMPWTESDAVKHTGLANTPRRRRLWSETANHVLTSTGDDAKAIKFANAAVNRDVQASMNRRMDQSRARTQQPRFI